MLYKVGHHRGMTNPAALSGEDMKRARESMGLTQAEFGELLEPAEEGKTIGNWERAGIIPPKKRGKVAEVIGTRPEHDDPQSGLDQYTDFELLIELGRRLDRVARREAELLARHLSQYGDQSADRNLQRSSESGSNTLLSQPPVRRRTPAQGFASPPRTRRSRDDDARTEDPGV